MYCVPFYKKVEQSSSGNTIVKLVLFLSKGGTSLLEGISSKNLQTFCEENGFVVKNQIQTDSELFLEIDVTKTEISSFYSFEEAFKTMNECWRTFIVVLSPEQKDSWNVNSHFQSSPFATTLSKLASLPV